MYFSVGIAARMRVSSVTCPFSLIGTLKSTRTSTRLPVRSISRTVFLSIHNSFLIHCRGRRGRDREPILPSRICHLEQSRDAGLESVGHHRGEVGGTGGVTPLVVIPRQDPHHRALEHRRELGIDDAGAL